MPFEGHFDPAWIADDVLNVTVGEFRRRLHQAKSHGQVQPWSIEAVQLEALAVVETLLEAAVNMGSEKYRAFSAARLAAVWCPAFKGMLAGTQLRQRHSPVLEDRMETANLLRQLQGMPEDAEESGDEAVGEEEELEDIDSEANAEEDGADVPPDPVGQFLARVERKMLGFP